MNTEIREWLEGMWEYCQEHWIMILGVVAVLFVVLFSAGLAHSAKRDEAEAADESHTAAAPEENERKKEEAEPETAMEPDLKAELKFEPELEPEPESELEPEPESELELEPESELVPVEEVNVEAVSAEKPEGKQEVSAPAAQGVVESLIRSVEEASTASGQKVESIELKIEKAQLTIRYVGGEKRTETHDTEEAAGRAEEPAEREILPEETMPEETMAEETMAEETVVEEINLSKKFGIRNMNTARSGRVYTEEELLNQIRD